MKRLTLLLALIPAVSFAQDCKDIEKNIDQFTDEVRFSSPIGIEDTYQLHPIRYQKYIKKADTTYAVFLVTHSESVAIGKGVIILLKDGTKIVKENQEIKSKVTDDAKLRYTAFVVLNSEDISKLKNSDIKAFRLHIFDEDVPPIPYYRQMLNCILLAK